MKLTSQSKAFLQEQLRSSAPAPSVIQWRLKGSSSSESNLNPYAKITVLYCVDLFFDLKMTEYRTFLLYLVERWNSRAPKLRAVRRPPHQSRETRELQALNLKRAVSSYLGTSCTSRFVARSPRRSAWIRITIVVYRVRRTSPRSRGRARVNFLFFFLFGRQNCRT